MTSSPLPGRRRRTSRPSARGARPWPPSLAAERAVDPSDALTVTVERGRGGAVVRVVGDLDAYGAPLVAALVEHASSEGRTVHADLSGVPFADSHGLAPLLASGVRIRWASAPVRRVLRLLGLPSPGGARPLLLRHG